MVRSCGWMVLLSLPGWCSSHGAMTFPPPRSSRGLPADGGADGPGCVGGACFWFSVGCFTGCDACSNEGNAMYPTPADAHCKLPSEPTLNARELRTYNVDNTADDWTRYMPWRSPGRAPVANPCGVSGGYKPPGGNTPANPVPHGFPPFLNGTKIRPLVDKPKTVWYANSTANVSWAIYVNHGGGYQYRLCPKEADPTEECFQSNPLPFASTSSTIRFSNGSNFRINATDVSTGTHPANSMFRRNPIPACNCDFGEFCVADERKGRQFKAYQNVSGPSRCPTGTQFPPPVGFEEGYGYGGRDAPPPNTDIFYWSISDEIRVPPMTGSFVLSFRWDCEQTPQVWSSCADIEVH
jgi:hypothetical protein